MWTLTCQVLAGASKGCGMEVQVPEVGFVSPMLVYPNKYAELLNVGIFAQE